MELQKGKTKVGKQGGPSLYLFEIAKWKLGEVKWQGIPLFGKSNEVS